MELSQRKSELKSIIKECESRISKTPEGELYVSKERGSFRFYRCFEGKKAYITKKNYSQAVALAQKKYDLMSIKSAKKELEIIEQYEALNLPNLLKTVPVPLRKMIQVNGISDTEYIIKWQSTKYTHKRVSENTRYYTQNNEHVRSKSECIIADTLLANDIPYHYEMPISIDDENVQHPDFIVLNKRTGHTFLWEHFGMMDNREYCAEAIEKMNRYNSFGYYAGKNLITTFESSDCPLDTRTIIRQINTFLK